MYTANFKATCRGNTMWFDCLTDGQDWSNAYDFAYMSFGVTRDILIDLKLVK